MVGEDGDGLEVDKDGEENSDEEEVEVPPDPAHQVLMAAL